MEFIELEQNEDKDLHIVHLPFCPTRKLLVVCVDAAGLKWDLISNQNRKWTLRETDDTLWRQPS